MTHSVTGASLRDASASKNWADWDRDQNFKKVLKGETFQKLLKTETINLLLP